jgi:ubiquinone biosynthesis protein UbiJ
MGPPDREEPIPSSPLAALLGDALGRGQQRAVRLVLAALEHVLHQQAWARDKLRMHAGRTVRVGVDAAPPAGLPAPELLATIDATGALRPAEPGATPSATLLVKPSVDALFAMVRDGPRGLSRHLRVDGDVMLAATLGELAQHLRWDAEEDLSRVVGDVIAHRIAGLGRAGVDRVRELGERLGSTAVQFAARDDQPLATRRDLGALREGIAAADLRMQALESRVARLAAGR